MERRLSVLQKHSRDRHSVPEGESQSASSLTSSTHKPRLSRAETIASSGQHTRSRSSSLEPGRNRSRPSSHAGTPVPDEITNSARRPSKRRLKTELDGASDSKRTKRKSLCPSEVRTSLEYHGLDLPGPTDGQNYINSTCNHTDEPVNSIMGT